MHAAAHPLVLCCCLLHHPLCCWGVARHLDVRDPAGPVQCPKHCLSVCLSLATQPASAHLMTSMPSSSLRALSRSGCCPLNCMHVQQHDSGRTFMSAWFSSTAWESDLPPCRSVASRSLMHTHLIEAAMLCWIIVGRVVEVVCPGSCQGRHAVLVFGGDRRTSAPRTVGAAAVPAAPCTRPLLLQKHFCYVVM